MNKLVPFMIILIAFLFWKFSSCEKQVEPIQPVKKLIVQTDSIKSAVEETEKPRPEIKSKIQAKEIELEQAKIDRDTSKMIEVYEVLELERKSLSTIDDTARLQRIEIIRLQGITINNLQKELRKQKRQKVFVAIGGVALVVITVIIVK